MSVKYVQLGHPALLCNDYETTLDFYTKKLGFKHMFSLHHEDGSLWLTYLKVSKGQYIELFFSQYSSPNKTAERSFHHFCLEVDDISALMNQLKDKGVEVYRGPVDGGVKMELPAKDHNPGLCGSLCAFIRDPEGNDIELMQFTDKSKQLM